MDDLSRLLRDLNGKAIGHEVSYATAPDDDRATYAVVTAPNLDANFSYLAADFSYNGTHWDLLNGYYRGRRESIEGLLKIIEEA